MIRLGAVSALALLTACGNEAAVRNGPQALSPSGGAMLSAAAAPVAAAPGPMSAPTITTMADQTVVIVDAQPAPVIADMLQAPPGTMTTITERADDSAILGVLGGRARPGSIVGTTIYTLSGN